MLDAPTDFDGLVSAWLASVQDIAGIASGLDAHQWQRTTGCPGWSVADVVAHVIDVESMLAGDPRPAHEPNWSSLPHVTSDFARMTEVGVDARRGRSPQELLDELDQIIERRQHQLANGPRDLGVEVHGFAAAMLPLGQLLRMRTFDSWVHGQDIRDAVGLPGEMEAPGAQVTASLMLQALPRIWGKSTGAPVGSVLRVEILGPGITTLATVEVMPDGRAALTDGELASAAPPSVTVRGSWPSIMHMMAGRPQPAGAAGADLQISGDPDLVERLVPALNISP